MVSISIVLMVTALYDSYALAGRVAAVFAIAQAICAPQLAKFVDRLGQAKVMRKALAVAMVALLALGAAAMLAGPEAILYITAALGGATAGSMGSMVRARWSLILDDPRQVHTAFSLESALDELVFVVGPVLATFLATAIHPAAGLVVAVLAAGSGGFWFLSQRRTEPAPSGRPDAASSGSVMRKGGMIIVAIVFAAVGIIFGGVDVSTIAFAQERGARHLAGVLLAICASGSLISGLLYGARHFTSALWKRFIAGVLFIAAGVSLFFFIDTIVVLAAVMFVVGFSISPTVIAGNALVQSMVPRSRLTEGLTWVVTAIGIGLAAGMSLAGQVIETFDAHGGYGVVLGAGWLAALVALAGAPVLRRADRKAVSQVPAAGNSADDAGSLAPQNPGSAVVPDSPLTPPLDPDGPSGFEGQHGPGGPAH